MIGVDTNILVRAFAQDDRAQYRATQDLLNAAEGSGTRVYINVIVLCELAWTLQRTYRFDRQRLVRTIDVMLTIPTFEIEHRALVSRALSAFGAGRAGFPDYLIGEINAARRAAPTATFDRGLRGSELFRVLG